MPNLVKTLVAEEYTRLFGSAEGLLVVATAGLSVAESEALRIRLDEAGARLRMVRNNLARRTLAEMGHEFPATTFTGNVCIVLASTEGCIHAAKVLSSPEVKKLGKVSLLGALFDGSQLSAEDTRSLAGVPDKLTLRAQLLGVVQGPARSLASLINALPSGLARVLQAHVDTQPAAGDPPAADAGEEASAAAAS